MNSTLLISFIVTIIVMNLVCLKLAKRVRLIKYAPSIFLSLGLVFFGVRFFFFQQGFSAIVDIVMLIILGISLAFSLLLLLMAKLSSN